MKVKVVFGDARLVIPCGEVTDKVERLVEDINRRFQAHLGDPTVSAKELITADGYLINSRDVINEVIADGEGLKALDFASWLKLNVPLLEKGGYKLARNDMAEGNSRNFPIRYAEIGKHKHNKLYVKLGGNTADVDKLELFDAESLRTFGKDGRALVAHKAVKDDKWDWSIEVHFIVEKGVVVAAELAVRATSDPRTHIEVVPINVADLKLGEVKVIQTATFGKPNKTYTLPAPIREGPAFAEADFRAAHLEPEGIVENPVPENNLATGDIGLEIKQKDATQADQGWKESDGYWNKFYNNVAIFNPLEKEIALVKITSAFEKDGEWIEMNTTLGVKQGYYNYSWGSRHEGFALGPNDRFNLAVNSSVKVNAKQFDRERRAHNSLPSPLRIRISFEDKEGKKSHIIIEHKNQPLYLSTKESREAATKKKIAFFLSADDLDAEARVWTHAVEDPKDKDIEFTNRGSNSTNFINKSSLDKIVFQAKKEGKSELPVPNISYKNNDGGYSVTATALIDLENQWVYALRFEVLTNTSRAVDHYLLPDLFA